jgi:NADPH:quinone reductase-like Zn-dependent oxidoreductase
VPADFIHKGGALVSILGQTNPAMANQYGLTAIGHMTRVTTDVLTRLAQLAENGVMTIHVDRGFPLDQAGRPFELLEEGQDIVGWTKHERR